MRQQYPDRSYRPDPSLARARPAALRREASQGVEALEERRLFSSPLSLGINANNITASNYKAIVKALQDSKTTTVRLWYGFTGYDDRTLSSSVKFAKKFHNDGFDVMLAVVPDNGETGTAEQTRELFGWLVQQEDITKYVDRWEVGNEEDSKSYWKGTLKSYLTDYLIPASKVLHSVGETVVSGGVSWNPEDINTLVQDGMLKWVDMVGYHPYRRSLSDLEVAVKRVKEIVGDTPLIASEWNVRGHEHDGNYTAWAHDVLKFWPVIRDNFYASYYFAATTQDSPAGPGGILNRNGTPHDPFYSSYMLFQRDPGTITGGDDGGYTGGKGDGNADSGGDGSGSSDSGGDDSGSGSGGSSSSGGTDSGGSTGGSTSGGSSSGGQSTGSKGGTTSGGSKGGTSSGGSSSGSKGGTSSGGTTTPKPPKPAPKPVAPPVLDGLTLFNANNQRTVRAYASLSGVTSFDLADMGTDQMTLLASANKKTKSVKFTVDGTAVVDNSRTFSLFGEKGSSILGGTFRAHTYLITAQAFSGADATGRASAIQTYTITVTDSRPADVLAAAAKERRRVLEAAERRKRRAAGGSVLTNLPT